MSIQNSLHLNFVKAFVLLVFSFLFLTPSVHGQNTSGIKPQYWSNATVAWEPNENLFVQHSISFNVLVDKELPWSEFSFNNTAAYRFNDLISANGGLYIATTKQSKSLNSLEIRPYIGLRLSTKMQKRAAISNLSRLEWRHLDYSDNTRNSNFRLRNRTTGVLAINQKSILNNNTLSLFAYFEAFHNFNEEVVERYFTLLKYKIGFNYRFSARWRINGGVLFNQAKNTVVEPSQAPANVVTNYILEWGVTYGIIK